MNLKKYLLNQISVIIDDNNKFSYYFKENYTIVYWGLTVLKIVSGVLMYFSMCQDFEKFNLCLLHVINVESINVSLTTKSWTVFIYYFYICLLVLEFIMAILIIFCEQGLIQNKVVQIIKKLIKICIWVFGGAYAVAFSFSEQSLISNFVHTTLPGGRGYDFEKGDFIIKLKGHILFNVLGHDKMIEAVAEHGPYSKILSHEHIDKIVADPKYHEILAKKPTFPGKPLLNVPIIPKV